MKDKMTLSVQVSKQLYDKLNELSAKYGISKSEIVRRGIIREINSLEKEG